ncbi:Zinc finger protein 300, partial [Galemys pyrenaicus]
MLERKIMIAVYVEKPLVKSCMSLYIRELILGKNMTILNDIVNSYRYAECGKAFPQKSDLVIPQRIHTVAKPIQCSISGKAFTQK